MIIGRIVTAPLRWAAVEIMKSMQDVEQDTRSLLMCEYRGRSVRMIPSVDASRPKWCRVVEWVPDPEHMKAVDEAIEKEAAEKSEREAKAVASMPKMPAGNNSGVAVELNPKDLGL